MARGDAGDLTALCNEATTCPMCLQYFTNPVIIAECGHSFCYACLIRFWGEQGAGSFCPWCRESVQQSKLILNRQLANFVEIAKQLSLRGGPERAREADRECEKRRESLKLCLVCDKSREHENHKVIPREEAFQEYKDQICSNLKNLKAEREKLLTYKASTEKASHDLLNQTEEEKQKITATVQQMHRFLEEREKIFLAYLEEVKKEVARNRDEHMARLSRELSTLEAIIQVMEENIQVMEKECRQPASEFLQDTGRTLQRYEKKEVFENPVAFPPELTCRIREFCDRKPRLEGVRKQFPDLLVPGAELTKGLKSCLNQSVEASSAMASASQLVHVEEELNCPICMEYLTDPVTLDCGHNFCRGCITHYCETWEDLGDLLCPLCKARIKRGNFRPNWQLANIVERIKLLPLNPGKEDLCVRHKEKLNLFCKEDKKLLCVGCERSPEHRAHSVLLLEEAAKEYKDQICSRLKIWKAEREKILTHKADTKKESQNLIKQLLEERQKTMTDFRQIHQFLEEEEKILLAQMEEVEKEIARRRDKHMARLSRELSSLEIIIREMEEKCQQPASELLLDMGRTLQRCEKKEVFESPVAFPPQLTCRIRKFCLTKHHLEGVRKQFPANLTLDPDTAHPQLVLSADRKSVWRGDQCQALPNNPERFDRRSFVLGREGFTAGRHFWEVIVESEGGWAVGVARKSVRRKGNFVLSLEEGIWAVRKWRGQYRVLESPHTLSLSQELERIRVTLNYAEGQVAFSDADTGVHLYTYSGASFRGETLFPFFFVTEEDPLTLFP